MCWTEVEINDDLLEKYYDGAVFTEEAGYALKSNVLDLWTHFWAYTGKTSLYCTVGVIQLFDETRQVWTRVGNGGTTDVDITGITGFVDDETGVLAIQPLPNLRIVFAPKGLELVDSNSMKPIPEDEPSISGGTKPAFNEDGTCNLD